MASGAAAGGGTDFLGVSALAYLEGTAVSETRSLVAELCRQFYTLGWVSGTGGSITIKVYDESIPRPHQLIVMSPSGQSQLFCWLFLKSRFIDDWFGGDWIGIQACRRSGWHRRTCMWCPEMGLCCRRRRPSPIPTRPPSALTVLLSFSRYSLHSWAFLYENGWCWLYVNELILCFGWRMCLAKVKFKLIYQKRGKLMVYFYIHVLAIIFEIHYLIPVIGICWRFKLIMHSKRLVALE